MLIYKYEIEYFNAEIDERRTEIYNIKEETESDSVIKVALEVNRALRNEKGLMLKSIKYVDVNAVEERRK